MSVLSDLEAKLGIVETDVVNFFSTTLPNWEKSIAAGINKLAADFDDVLQWLGAHGQEIATDVAGIVGIVAAAGVGIPAPVLAASTALNAAVSAVNTAIAAQQASAAAGGSNLQQAIAAGQAGYVALKTAQQATAAAQATVASPPKAAS